MKKVSITELGLDFSNLSGEPRAFLEKSAKMVCDVVNKALDGCMDKDDVEAKFKSINDGLKGFDGDKFAEAIKNYDDLCAQVKNLGDSIEKMKQSGMSQRAINKFDEKVIAMLESEKYRTFAEGHAIKTGTFEGFSLKDIVSLTDSYTGNLLTTQQQDRVVSAVSDKPLHMRDVVTVLQGDPNFPNLAFTQVYDFDRNARYVTENGMLPESSMKAKELNYSTKRLGTHLRISKRMLKSRAYMRSFIINMLPEAVYMAEDWNMIFGNGLGENLDGIVNTKGVESIEGFISTAIVTGAAGSVKSITPYGTGAMVEFNAPYDAIKDGMMITLASATATALNKTFPVVKVNDRQVLLLSVTLAAAETRPEDVTFTVNNAAFKSIESPNSGDVIKTGFAAMNIGQFYPNAIVLHPATVNAIECEKDTMGRNLDLVTVDANGYKRVGGRLVIEYSGMPANKYLIGDFVRGCNLVDFTNLSLEFAEDVNTKLSNEIVLIAQEEIIFPIYMPWVYAYGDLAALKTAITKA